MPTNQQIFQAILDLKGEVGEMKGNLTQIINTNMDTNKSIEELSKRVSALESAANISAGAKSTWRVIGKYTFEAGKLIGTAVLGAYFGGRK